MVNSKNREITEVQHLYNQLDYLTIGSMGTRERILDSAQRLIQTRSFEGFSLQDIADEIGIRKASLYHHFESKDDVAVAMLERAADWVSAQFKKAEGREPRERLEAYFDLFREIHGKAERMCPGGSFAAVFDAVSSPLQASLHRFSKMHLDWLEDVVRDGAEQNQFTIGDQRPRDVAAQILASVQGALLVGRLSSDRHVLGAVAEGIRRYLAYVPKRTH
jgi:TetR/AcrR family transcriptional regulator, transcriptional repressor for nem operon